MTTADVWMSLKELDPWRILTLIGLLLAILCAYFGSGWGRAGVSWTFAVTRVRALNNLKKRRAWLQQLQESDRTYTEYLLSGILWVLLLFAGQLQLEGVMVSLTYKLGPVQEFAGAMLTFTRYSVGTITVLIAMSRLITSRTMRRFDRVMARLDRHIATLEAQVGGPPARAAATDTVPTP